MMTKLLRVLGVLVVVFTAGCSSQSRLMSPAPAGTPAIKADPDYATVVFVRPSGVGFAIKFTIFDQKGRFLGEAVAEGHFASKLKPGEYYLLAAAEDLDLVHATVAAGKVYYIWVAPQMGVWSARVELNPIKPSETEEWDKLKENLPDTKRYLPKMAEGQAYLNEDPNALRERIADGKKEWASLDAEEREARTIHPQDGIGQATRPSIAVPAPAATAPAAPTQAPESS